MQVQVHHGLEIGHLFGGICRGRDKDAGVVNQHVEFTDRCRHGGHRGFILNIELAPADTRILKVTRGVAITRVDYFR